MCSIRDPFVDGVGGRDALRIGLFRGGRNERASGYHWLPFRTSYAAHPCKNLEVKFRLEEAKGDTLRQELVRCAMGVGGSLVVGTAGDGWCTLGDRRNIGADGIGGCRSERDSF